MFIDGNCGFCKESKESKENKYCLYLGMQLHESNPQSISHNRTYINNIQFDDLGFGDVGFNGGEFPTPILDELANNDAIKINRHYTEQVIVTLYYLKSN